MTWRPPIEDPVGIEADDDRERCEQCGKSTKFCRCAEDLADIF